MCKANNQILFGYDLQYDRDIVEINNLSELLLVAFFNYRVRYILDRFHFSKFSRTLTLSSNDNVIMNVY